MSPDAFGPPIDVRPLFPGERAALLDVLRDLDGKAWERPTDCAGWTVADLARHLLGGDFGVLSGRRDGHANPAFGEGFDIASFASLVAAIDRQNDRWMVAARRLSPRLTTDLLAAAGEWTAAWWAGIDMDAAGIPVDWAGPGPAPAWLDVAREYTERWVHGSQIREAVGAPLLDDPEWLGPVIETLARALPRALAATSAPDGTVALLRITGPAGGEWRVRRDHGAWRWVDPGADAPDPAVTLSLDADLAWRLWTRGVDPDAARRRAVLGGDPALLDAMLAMVSVLTPENRP